MREVAERIHVWSFVEGCTDLDSGCNGGGRVRWWGGLARSQSRASCDARRKRRKARALLDAKR